MPVTHEDQTQTVRPAIGPGDRFASPIGVQHTRWPSDSDYGM